MKVRVRKEAVNPWFAYALVDAWDRRVLVAGAQWSGVSPLAGGWVAGAKGGRGMGWCFMMESLSTGRGNSQRGVRGLEREHERRRFEALPGPALALAKHRHRPGSRLG